MARFTAYVAGIELVLLALERGFKLAGATRIANPLQGWTTFLGYLLACLLAFLILRWFRSHVMWSVRNRLIVTYLFIGGVPVTLAVIMALGIGYLAVEHLATFLAVSEIRDQEQRLSAANAAAAEQIVSRRKLPREIMASDTLFPGRSLTIVPVSDAPTWLKDGFTGLASDNGQLYLRAANLIQTPHGQDMVISSVPFDQKFLGRIATNLGALSLSDNPLEQDVTSTSSSSSAARTQPQRGLISAGAVSSPQASVDPEVHLGGLIQTVDWTTGEPRSKFLAGVTRPSAMYRYLAPYMGVWTGVIGGILLGTAIAFAVVVLIALIIGIRLTRTLTYSVANLYKATEHINRGEFTHRIQVRENDQLAALQRAFNSMTDSLQKLIAEQKEKERLQSELEIAHEVQAQLFPQAMRGTGTLELHGVCRPARIVSGDYYDFLAYGPEQVGIAVGDISGKGISAALLMATIHSAVRAYEQELLAPVTAASASYGTDMRIATVAPRVARPSPAQMLWLLNRHIYQTTQPEKYATLFLGFYEDDSCRLTYSNAGHLPPVILSENGEIRRLDIGGTVIGLFDDLGYEEQTVELYPGDIFIAFSDGMTEPENEFGEFGEDRLIETIAAHRHLPLNRISELALAAVEDWIGSTEPPDDVTLVLARRMG